MASINGTVAEQANGSIFVQSECLILDSDSLIADLSRYWIFNDQDIIQAGYSVRDSRLTFDLPYFDYPTLPSG